eukprot:scaffold2051_cov389-Prasinococcus_capsulatus_cf.AAC.9
MTIAESAAARTTQLVATADSLRTRMPGSRMDRVVRQASGVVVTALSMSALPTAAVGFGERAAPLTIEIRLFPKGPAKPARRGRARGFIHKLGKCTTTLVGPPRTASHQATERQPSVGWMFPGHRAARRRTRQQHAGAPALPEGERVAHRSSWGGAGSLRAAGDRSSLTKGTPARSRSALALVTPTLIRLGLLLGACAPH